MTFYTFRNYTCLLALILGAFPVLARADVGVSLHRPPIVQNTRVRVTNAQLNPGTYGYAVYQRDDAKNGPATVVEIFEYQEGGDNESTRAMPLPTADLIVDVSLEPSKTNPGEVCAAPQSAVEALTRLASGPAGELRLVRSGKFTVDSTPPEAETLSSECGTGPIRLMFADDILKLLMASRGKNSSLIFIFRVESGDKKGPNAVNVKLA